VYRVWARLSEAGTAVTKFTG